VLFFPHSDDGWQCGMLMENPRDQSKNKTEKRMWYGYYFYERPSVFSSLFLGQQLFQQFFVDARAT
jgi:uncharacterized protein (DUF608 family)